MDALKSTLFITIVGTILNIFVTFFLAYGLTKKDLPFRKGIIGLVIFALLFNAGIIPNYMLVKNLGLINSYWSIILPVLTFSYSVIIAKSFLSSLPAELEESAKIDGCSYFGIFFRIIVPLSMASIATLTLFFAVGHWNVYFKPLMYLTDYRKRTLQVYVKTLLVDGTTEGGGLASGDDFSMPSETIRLATVVLAMLPILIVYPFVQRHFIKGVMLGSVKG
jgi:putative aldouronate transport system permease protein